MECTPKNTLEFTIHTNQRTVIISFSHQQLNYSKSVCFATDFADELVLAYKQPPSFYLLISHGKRHFKKLTKSWVLNNMKALDVFMLSALKSPCLCIRENYGISNSLISSLKSSLQIKREIKVASLSLILFSPILSNKMLDALKLDFRVGIALLLLISENIYSYFEFTHRELIFLSKQYITNPQCYKVVENMWIISRNSEKFITHYERTEKIIASSSIELIKSIKLVFTPTTVYVEPINIPLSNRIVRKYDTNDYSNDFIRVQMVDDNKNKIMHLSKELISYIRQLYYSTGIKICEKHYSFLGYSNSQMKQFGSWLVNINKHSPDTIFYDSGEYNESTISKLSARYAQCFTTSVGTLDKNKQQFKVTIEDDVNRNNYDFTDGIGVISKNLINAVMTSFYRNDTHKLKKIDGIIHELGIATSAFQFRFMGAKGVLSVKHDIKSDCVVLRKSQVKFNSTDSTLEVVADSTFRKGFLNKQVILLLAARGIALTSITSLQQQYINEIMCLTEEGNNDIKISYIKDHCIPSAFSAIETFYDKTHSLCIPFINRCLYSIAENCLTVTKLNARILVKDSAVLMGISDEYGELQYGEVFCQYIDKHSCRNIVLGKVFVTKNPCLYPSDIRVLNAVDKPQLHCYINVLVFPQKGSRPHPNEISGSDLDGDRYLIVWEPSLIPSYDDMKIPKFTAAAPQNKNESFELVDVLENMLLYHNESIIGLIATLHSKIANLSPDGAYDSMCIQLAEQHSIEVDSAKSGIHGDTSILGTAERYLKSLEEKNSQGIFEKMYKMPITRFAKCNLNKENINLDKLLTCTGWEMYASAALNLCNEYENDLRIITKYLQISETQLFCCDRRRAKENHSNSYEDFKRMCEQSAIALLSKHRNKFQNTTDYTLLLASACYNVSKSRSILSFPWLICAHELANIYGGETTV